MVDFLSKMQDISTFHTAHTSCVLVAVCFFGTAVLVSRISKSEFQRLVVRASVAQGTGITGRREKKDKTGRRAMKELLEAVLSIKEN